MFLYSSWIRTSSSWSPTRQPSLSPLLLLGLVTWSTSSSSAASHGHINLSVTGTQTVEGSVLPDGLVLQLVDLITAEINDQDGRDEELLQKPGTSWFIEASVTEQSSCFCSSGQILAPGCYWFHSPFRGSTVFPFLVKELWVEWWSHYLLTLVTSSYFTLTYLGCDWQTDECRLHRHCHDGGAWELWHHHHTETSSSASFPSSFTLSLFFTSLFTFLLSRLPSCSFLIPSSLHLLLPSFLCLVPWFLSFLPPLLCSSFFLCFHLFFLFFLVFPSLLLPNSLFLLYCCLFVFTSSSLSFVLSLVHVLLRLPCLSSFLPRLMLLKVNVCKR